MRVLVVEDNTELAENIADYLKIEGYQSVTAASGRDALKKLRSTNFDLVILDWNIPQPDGLEVCRQLRQENQSTPVLMLTAKSHHHDVVMALSAGADDYLRKPFAMEELLARALALLRRSKQISQERLALEGGIVIDLKRRSVSKNGKPVKLSPKEYLLLEYMVLNHGRVQERLTILDNVWGESEDLMFSQTVDVHIAYLRKKLGKNIITTAIGGYLLELPNADQN